MEHITNQLIERTQACHTLEALQTELEFVLEEAAESQPTFDAIIELADYYRRRGYRDYELWLLIQLYQVKPRKKIAYLVARVYSELLEYEQALPWIQLTHSEKLIYQTTLLEADILYHLAQYSQAVALLEPLIKAFPTRHEAYQLMATIQLALDNPARARYYYQVLYDYFGQAIDLRDIRLKLVTLSLESELVDIAALERLMLDPELPLETAQEYYLLAVAYMEAELVDEAIQMAREAITLDLDYVDAQLLLLHAYTHAEQLPQAKETLDWLVQVIPVDDHLMYELAQYALLLEHVTPELVAKLRDYYMMSQSEDEAYDLLEIIVHALMQQATPVEALATLTQFAEHFPDAEYLDYLYAQVYAALGKVDQATHYYEQAMALGHRDEELVAQAVAYFLATHQLKAAITYATKFEQTQYDTPALQKLRKQLLA